MFKPRPEVYALVTDRFAVTPAEVTFVSSNRWDVMGAAAFGFREVETTVPVLGDAPSNAIAVSIGAAIGSPGLLVQCSVEEALELEMGMRGLVSYAETVSLYGTEQIFVDGDDTLWTFAWAGDRDCDGTTLQVDGCRQSVDADECDETMPESELTPEEVDEDFDDHTEGYYDDNGQLVTTDGFEILDDGKIGRAHV